MNTPQTQPWYRQFWPWFLIALPATAVIASFYTIYLAVQNQPNLVEENYYQEGLSINDRIRQDRHASELGMQANLLFSEETGKVTVYLAGKYDTVDKLTLLISAPDDAALDRTYELKAVSDSLFMSSLQEQPKGRFYITLEPTDREWRLTGEGVFPRQDTLTLAHRGSTDPVSNE